MQHAFRTLRISPERGGRSLGKPQHCLQVVISPPSLSSTSRLQFKVLGLDNPENNSKVCKITKAKVKIRQVQAELAAAGPPRSAAAGPRAAAPRLQFLAHTASALSTVKHWPGRPAGNKSPGATRVWQGSWKEGGLPRCRCLGRPCRRRRLPGRGRVGGRGGGESL